MLVPLILAQWLVVAYVAHRAQHNGWLFYHDGTTTWTYTTAWILGGGHIPLPSPATGCRCFSRR